MPLKRKITHYLEDWYAHTSHKALCIFGARQIGKTTSVETFGKTHFSVFIKIDFIQDPQAEKIFENPAEVSLILEQIELFSKTKIVPGDTLILFDEIQECPKARTAIKYLVQDKTCRYVETGSLLGVKLDQIPSVPVGYEQLVNMYPLDFEEFLWACQVPEKTIQNLEECFHKRIPVPAYVHEEMKRIFLTYLVVGGMPESVNTFIQNHSIASCIPIQQSIWSLYSHDITKYAQRNEIVKILDIFESVPAQLNSSSIRFLLNKAAGKPKVRFDAYQSSLSWLTQAGIVLPCFNTAEPKFPLKLNEKRRLFRLYTLDTGLLCSQFEGIQIQLLQQDPSLNWGAILENAAAQAFCANGFELYYFNKKNLGELDFVLEDGTETFLIEMKSGKDYMHHPALDAALKIKDWTFKETYVFCSGNIKTEEQITYLPWYLLFLIRKTKIVKDQVSFNLEALDFDLPAQNE